MEEWILSMVDAYGYLGIAMLIIVENVFPPIPSEVILTFGGFLTTYTQMTAPGVILVSTIGSVVGAIILYGVGRLLPEERLIKLVEGPIGRILRFKRSDVEMAIGWFDRKGNIAVLLCRCVPIVRSLISVPAGMAKMGMKKFLLYTFIGSAVWNTILVTAGAAAGEAWPTVVAMIDQYKWIVVVAGVIFAVMVAALWIWFRFRKKK